MKLLIADDDIKDCYCCHEEYKYAVRLTDGYGFYGSSLNVCKKCLKKALELIEVAQK